MPKPFDRELEQLEKLFIEWSTSKNQITLNHLFEIIESHESEQIRELAIDTLRDHFPKDNIKSLVDMWITHPLPVLHELIEELIDSGILSKPLLSVIYLMLDRFEDLNKLDPDLIHLDKYMNTLDPLLGSLVFRRYSLLTSTDLQQTDIREFSIIDLIRLQDYPKLWENLLSYPIPFIVELIKILHEEKWIPSDVSDKLIYDYLVELLGVKGWQNVSSVMNTIVSIERDDKFRPLTKAELNNNVFFIVISPDLINRPDRITSHEFISRGQRSLCHPDLGIHIYNETIRFSNVDGLLHIPIYNSGGVELAEFNIAATNTNHFNMDEDGLYFTVKTKSGMFSVDIDAIASLLLPINKHSSGVSEIIPTMLERTTGKSNLVLQALNLLSTHHRGREFTLFDNKDTVRVDTVYTSSEPCNCVLSIDVGNISTKLMLLAGTNCDHTSSEWNFSTIINYRTPSEFITAGEVIEEDMLQSSQTIQNLKLKLFENSTRNNIMVHSSVITIKDAYIDFIKSVISKVTSEIDYEVNTLAITYSSLMSAGIDMWLKKELSQIGFNQLVVIEETIASMVNIYRLDNLRGNTLIFDFGSMHSSAILCRFDGARSRKRTRETRIKEGPIDPPVSLASISIPHGVNDLHPILQDISGSNNINDQIKDLLNGFKSEFSREQFDDIFDKSELFEKIQYLIRNIIVKGMHRGVNRDDITNIVLVGKFAKYEQLQKYINGIFKNIELNIHGSDHHNTTGISLIAQGQKFDHHSNQDYFLKISNRGSIGYTRIISRGELVTGIKKTFQIRPKAWFDKIVIDLWTRTTKFVDNEQDMPMKDNENIELRRDSSSSKFITEFLMRELIPIEDGGILTLKTNMNGKLSILIESESIREQLDTDIQLL